MVISFVWNANPARAYKMTFLGTKLPCNPETHTGLIEIAVFPLHLCEVVSQLFHYRKIEKHNSIIKQIMNKARGHLHRIGKYWIEIAVFPLHLCEVVPQLFHYRKIEKHNSIIKQIMNKARGHLNRIGKYCWIVHGTFVSSKESVPPHEQMTKVVFE